MYTHTGGKNNLGHSPWSWAFNVPPRCLLYRTIWSLQRQVLPQPLCQCGPNIFGCHFQNCGAGYLTAPQLWRYISSPHQESWCLCRDFHIGHTLYGTCHHTPFFQFQNHCYIWATPFSYPSPLLLSLRSTVEFLSYEKALIRLGSVFVGPGSTKGITNPWEKSETQNFLDWWRAKLSFHLPVRLLTGGRQSIYLPNKLFCHECLLSSREWVGRAGISSARN